MFVCQDVDDLLDELHGRHMVAVLGCPDQVVTHPLLFPLVRRVLGTRGLVSKTEKKHMTHSANGLIRRAKKMYFPIHNHENARCFHTWKLWCE